MNRVGLGLATMVFGAAALAASVARADERPKGPEEDGTKPALTRIAGEGLLNSHAFDYLTELQRHTEELKRSPSEWMPWNYRETLARLVRPAAA